MARIGTSWASLSWNDAAWAAGAWSGVPVVTFAGGGGFSDYPAKKRTKKEKAIYRLPEYADAEHPLRTAPVRATDDPPESVPPPVVAPGVVVARDLPAVRTSPTPRIADALRAPVAFTPVAFQPVPYLAPVPYDPMAITEDEADMLDAVMAYMASEDTWQ